MGIVLIVRGRNIIPFRSLIPDLVKLPNKVTRLLFINLFVKNKFLLCSLARLYSRYLS
jgi:hypothetical protein